VQIQRRPAMHGTANLKPYPIEVDFPDISGYRKGNTGIDYVHTFDSGIAGPHVMVNALTHGNEVCGAIAVAELLDRGVSPVKGKLTLSFANADAFSRFDPARPDAARFQDEDLNRVWNPAILEGARDTAELRRARAFRPIVDQVDFLLDLHSMHEQCPPLTVSGPLDKGIAFARQLGYPAHIVADEGHAEGRRMRDYGGFGTQDSHKNALLIECGQHWDARAVQVARDVTARFLHMLGILPPDVLAGWITRAGGLPQVIRITDAVVARTNGFAFTEDFRGLECIPERGTLIGIDDGEEIRTPYDDCVLVMPSLRQLRPGVTVVRFGRADLAEGILSPGLDLCFSSSAG
jgi:predicted deacylase